MKLKMIPLSAVQALIDDPNYDRMPNNHESRRFNNCHHTHAPITAALPSVEHAVPSPLPQHFNNWSPLITASQNIAASAWHALAIPAWLIHDFQLLQVRWQDRLQVNEALLAEVLDAWPSPSMRAAVFGSSPASAQPSCSEEEASKASSPDGPKYFLRLDACSPKDAALRAGNTPVTSPSDILRALISSLRAKGAMADWVSRTHEPFRVFLMPWNDAMDTAREFRCFCPPAPGTEGKMRVAAISQYRWFASFFAQEEAQRIAEEVAERAEEILAQIMVHAAGGR